MAKLTPAQAREKHARNLKASVPDITIGVNAVTEAPGKKAAAKADKMLANLTEAVRSGKWAQRVGDVTLEEWKIQMVEKGIPRIAQGIDGSAAKVEAFFSQLFPYQDGLQAKLKGMPDMTLEDNIGRMTTWVRGMAQFKPK
jgi:hypothetical protein